MNYLALTRFGLAVISRLSQAEPAPSRAQPVNENLFLGNLEKRISDLHHGTSDAVDIAVDAELANRNSSVNDALANQDPKALQLYSSFLSGMSYDRSARIVSGVEYGVRMMSTIPSKAEAQAETDRIVAAYRGAQGKKHASSPE